MSVEEVMKEVLADRIFYENSGGGLTLSGGEPLFHFAFTQALLEAARREKLHTCLETSGYAPPENLRALLPLVDLWLWDVKTPPENHEKWTGVSSALILENLRMIDALNAKIRLRCPLIPGVNDGEADLIRLAGLADSLRGIQGIDLEPYHPLGESKGARLGRISIFRAGFTDRSKIAEYGTTMKRYTKIPVHCS